MKLETFEQWKKKICDGAVKRLYDAATSRGYRTDDIFDYVCDHIDLDNRFDEIIAKVCRREYNTSLYEEYMHTHHVDNLRMIVAFEIINEVEENIRKGVY